MLLATIIAVAALTVSTEADPLNVSVYYEALCPDSKAFITTQLYPAYKLISEYLNIRFVPFGNAQVSNETGTLTFTCQHGPAECHGNEIQACALLLNSYDKSVEFINCAMDLVVSSTIPVPDADLQTCAESNEISWDEIQECMASGEGAQLFIQNGLRTATVVPPITYVPTVVFNGEYDATLQDSGEHNFLPTACTLLNQEPDACASVN